MRNRTEKCIGIRNGIKIYSTLKAHKKINPVSQKQKERDKEWAKITEQKIADLGYRCEWCGRLGQRNSTDNFLSGHHIIKRRFKIDTYENCYIAHWISCHQFIEQNGIDVRIYPNKIAWEKRNA